MKVGKFFLHDCFWEFRKFFRETNLLNYLIVKTAKIDFENLNFCIFRGSLRKNLQSKIHKVGFGLIESIGILRTSLDAGCFYMVWSLLTSTSISSALGRYIWKISIVLSRIMSFLHFMFSLTFWNQSLVFPNLSFLTEVLENDFTEKFWNGGKSAKLSHCACLAICTSRCAAETQII